MTFQPTSAMNQSEAKPATPRTRKMPTIASGTPQTMRGSCSTKLPSSIGFISAANAVSVSAKPTMPRIAMPNSRL